MATEPKEAQAPKEGEQGSSAEPAEPAESAGQESFVESLASELACITGEQRKVFDVELPGGRKLKVAMRRPDGYEEIEATTQYQIAMRRAYQVAAASGLEEMPLDDRQRKMVMERRAFKELTKKQQDQQLAQSQADMVAQFQGSLAMMLVIAPKLLEDPTTGQRLYDTLEALEDFKRTPSSILFQYFEVYNGFTEVESPKAVKN